MPNGGKKAVFPTLALHDHDPRAAAHDQKDRTKKMLHQQSRSRSESKDSPEQERVDHFQAVKQKPTKSGRFESKESPEQERVDHFQVVKQKPTKSESKEKEKEKEK